LRTGRQPYGVLPVTALASWKILSEPPVLEPLVTLFAIAWRADRQPAVRTVKRPRFSGPLNCRVSDHGYEQQAALNVFAFHARDVADSSAQHPQNRAARPTLI
jgi:hypothetical protein